MIRHLHQVLAVSIVILFAGGSAIGQEMVWDASLGGVYNEGGSAGLQTSDGGYLIVGSTFSYGAGKFDIYLMKLNSGGATVWTET